MEEITAGNGNMEYGMTVEIFWLVVNSLTGRWHSEQRRKGDTLCSNIR